VTEASKIHDIVIIGGGLAGMTAAVRALELGLTALVIEKGEGEDYPCNSRQSGGVMHIGFLDPYREAEELTAVIVERTAGDADRALAAALVGSGGRLLDWLQDKGARFVRFNEQEGYRWCMAPPRSLRAGIDWQGRGPDMVMRGLVEQFEASGGAFLSGTRATGLLLDEDRCAGVMVEKAGVTARIGASHVLIADGGFQANPELYAEHIGGEFDRVFQRGARTGMGDGMKMGVAAGATLTETDRFYGHVLCRDALHNDNVWPYPEIDAMATSGIVVDASGARIVDEGRSGVYLANALAARPADAMLYAIFDAAIWEEPGKSARIPANPLLEEAGGTVLRADSLEALAEMAGIDAGVLKGSVENHNAALAKGTLDQLPVPRSTTMRPWPITEAPFMAIPICPGITYTMGGIAIDGTAQVLDETGTPIPGLLAAGAATGGLEGGRDAGYIGGLMKAGVFGLIAAERVAALKALAEGKIVDADATAPSIAPAKPPPRRPRRDRLAKYPMLGGIVRYGKAGGIGLSVLVATLVLWLCWPAFENWAIPMATAAGLITGVIALSFAELVRLITDMLLPEA
jgi:fumarate reductase flavoprotein subunit